MRQIQKYRILAALALVVPLMVIAADEVVWTNDGTVAGIACKDGGGNYTPVVITAPGKIRVYSSGNCHSAGTWYVSSGTWTNAGKTVVALSPSKIFDQTGKPYIRTSAVVRSTTGQYYAMITVGDGYPSVYRPAWATSPDGLTWTYRGKIKVDGAYQDIDSTSDALILQEDKPAVLDTVNPGNNRFLAWEDVVTVQENGGTIVKRLVMIYSADGVDWRFARDSSGNIMDLWVPPPVPSACATPGCWAYFETATRTPSGYHLIAANGWPATSLTHLFSCDAVKWRIIEVNSDVYSAYPGKGTNLVYEPATNLVHALTWGVHWQYTEQAFACP